MLDFISTLYNRLASISSPHALEELVNGAKRAEEAALYQQGMTYFERFERGGELDDLEQAITNWQRVADMMPDGHPNKPNCLSSLGAALMNRFEYLGSPADFESGVSLFREAVDLTPDEQLEKPSFLSNLGGALETRFQRHGLPADLEEAIQLQRTAVHLSSNHHPDKPRFLSNLGASLNTLYIRYGSPVALEEAILWMRTVVNVTPDNHPSKPMYLSNLGLALLSRFNRRGSPRDLEGAVKQQRKAVDLTPDGHPTKPRYLSNLGTALDRRFDQHGSLVDLENAISHKRKAVSLTPDEHPDRPAYLNSLGNALEARFERQGLLADLEEAILHQRAAVDLTLDDHLSKPMYLNSLANSLEGRFAWYGSLADLEEAISQNRLAVDLTPDDHPSKLALLHSLGSALEKRFGMRGSLVDLEEALLHKRKAVDLVPENHTSKPGLINSLGCTLEMLFERSGSPADLEEAISATRRAVSLTQDGHPLKPSYLNNLGNFSDRRYRRDGALPDLEDSILHRQEAVRLMPRDDPIRAAFLCNLSWALSARFERLGDRNDLDGALSAARESAESPATSSRFRLQGALVWARCCTLGSTSSLTAYECAVGLLPRLAWLGLAVDDQYALLADAGSATRDAVAAAIAEGEYATAVEWAEQGRCIVWQNLLSLRTPLEELRSQHSELASRLQEISQQLERPVAIRDASDGSKLSDTASSQMTLAMERDKLIDEVKSKPGFESFMKAKSLEELAPAARDGTVVFVNLAENRCDALVLLTDDQGAAHVVPIPLERVTPERAEKLSEKLIGLLSKAGVRAGDTRKHKVHGVSDDKDSIFREILQTLWLDYVKPILDKLAYQVNLNSPPRLWWCTTGPLAFLPLHAAGMYDITEAGHKLSDYVVPSYTPTLAALLAESHPISSDAFKILTVAISNTPEAPLPCTEEETRKVQHLAANLPVISLINEEATKKRVLEGLEESTWTHLACHGEQVGGKPMESGIILHDGKLKLSELVKARLPNAEFAFLSACQTAVGDGGVPEESAHLAAGMLFAGYHGVVATMWSIQDDIAPRVAEDFYRYMFRNGKPNRVDAAYALHKAVCSLQESGVPFTSWVPFIHVGR